MKMFSKLIMAAVLFSHTALVLATSFDEKMGVFIKSAESQNLDVTKFQIMSVPSASNFISNKIMVASLKSGTGSLTSQQIADQLSQAIPVSLAIGGENDAVAAATLERALVSLKGKSLVAHTVAFIGNIEYEKSLITAATEAGLQLIFIATP